MRQDLLRKDRAVKGYDNGLELDLGLGGLSRPSPDYEHWVADGVENLLCRAPEDPTGHPRTTVRAHSMEGEGVLLQLLHDTFGRAALVHSQ